ncbi:MAG: cyclic nucleotide-binding/CBS domain-containing protein [Terriglobia bacterium]
MINLRDLFRNRELFHLSPRQSVADAARYMTDRNVGAVCVLDAGRLVGVLSERDMMKRVIAPNRDPRATSVADVMTSNPVVVEISADWQECLNRMKRACVRHLPVVEGQKLVGLLSLRDLLQCECDEKAEEIKLMQDYSYDVPPSKPTI